MVDFSLLNPNFENRSMITNDIELPDIALRQDRVIYTNKRKL